MDSSPDHVKQRLGAIENYLQHTPVYEQFKQLCSELVAENDLPYNPYPWLINKFQIIAQRLKCNSLICFLFYCTLKYTGWPKEVNHKL